MYDHWCRFNSMEVYLKEVYLKEVYLKEVYLKEVYLKEVSSFELFGALAFQINLGFSGIIIRNAASTSTYNILY